eukprot:CAMPEP_0119511692 /NCGR_PEP_ID=MMETSP1344-20130328/30279_1 /TAXON_ID=236787 /ORGANISM="Florenciella parvula, Strain CCMP2471" /LENGTH=87 /DNA_ID=CAMNT_0007548727 /DNA_START=434 /DNA_END=695 /DNA_ORIENTATION=-
MVEAKPATRVACRVVRRTLALGALRIRLVLHTQVLNGVALYAEGVRDCGLLDVAVSPTATPFALRGASGVLEPATSGVLDLRSSNWR